MITRDTTERLLVELADALELAIERGLDDQGVDRHIHAFLGQLRLAFAESRSRAVRLEMASSLFVHEDEDLTRASIRGRQQIEALRACEAGGLAFARGTDERDVRGLLSVSINVRRQRIGFDTACERLRAEGVRAITLLSASDEYEWAPIGNGPSAKALRNAGFQLELAAPVYRSMAMVVDEATAKAASGAAVDMSAARAAGESISTMALTRYDDLMQLGERVDFDLFTVQHSLRVALMATYVGAQMGASPATLTEIGAAGLMHDVGKGRVPNEILHKPGRLDEEERRIIQRHPELGTEILLDSPDVSPCALGAAFGHHLRFDGKGYPATRPWSESSKITSLVQICDVFEALTARRPYKAPYSPARAYKILFSDTGAFDPAVLTAFTRAMGLYPPGRFVRLSDGRLARVSVVGRALDRPTVRLLPDGDVFDLSAPEHARTSVLHLVEEQDALEELVGAHAEPDDAEAEREGRAAAAEVAAEQAARDAELDGGLSHGCGHGDDCRLC